MTKILSLLAVFVLVVLPSAASAQIAQNGGGGELGTFLENVLKFIDSVIIPFILAIGFLVFIWGIFNYFIIGGANEEAKENGKSLIMYAIAGFVVILAFWGIINIISNGIGLEDKLDSTPTVEVNSVTP